jgi:hypothetical protein
MVNGNSSEEKKTTVVNNYSTSYAIIHLILALFALYLSFKCNHGFNLVSFLAAFCCPYLYVPYILATKGMCNDSEIHLSSSSK